MKNSFCNPTSFATYPNPKAESIDVKLKEQT